MSDYFSALMRASGISLGIAADAMASAGDLGLDIERTGEEAANAAERWPAPLAEHSLPAAANPMQPSSHELRSGNGDAPTALDLPSPPIRERRADDARVPATAFADPVEGASSPSADDTESFAPSTATAQTLVQAALQWVAAGSTADGVIGASVSAAEKRASIAHAQDPSQDGMAPTQLGAGTLVPPLHLEGRAAIADGSSRETRTRARPHRDEASARAQPDRRGEAIEVSIGAIHVRVDAPAARTLALPAVPPAPAMPRPSVSARSPQSSRLARRALRRI